VRLSSLGAAKPHRWRGILITFQRGLNLNAVSSDGQGRDVKRSVAGQKMTRSEEVVLASSFGKPSFQTLAAKLPRSNQIEVTLFD